MTTRKSTKKGGASRTGATKKGATKKGAAKKGAAKQSAARTGGASGYQARWRVASDPRRPDAERAEAFSRLGNAVCDDPAVFAATLDVLRDREAPPAVREAALNALQAATFSAPSFDAC